MIAPIVSLLLLYALAGKSDKDVYLLAAEVIEDRILIDEAFRNSGWGG
jgi:hypothetical protein